MALTIGDTAPDFEADTTEGRISFHDWIGDGWAVLFSHPRNFTPVCTTELGYMAAIKPEFDRRGVKIIGLSVDPLDNHEKWAQDIAETQGTAPNYPIIADADFNVSKLYGMLPADTEGDPTERTPAQNATLRNVFVIGPDKKIKLVLIYPMTTGRNFDEVLRVLDSLQLTAEHKLATPGPVAAGRRRDHHRGGLQRGGQGALPGGLGRAAALAARRQAAVAPSPRRRAHPRPPRGRRPGHAAASRPPSGRPPAVHVSRTISVFVPVTLPLRRSRSITRVRSWMSLTRIQTSASGSPAVVKTAWTSGRPSATPLMSATFVLPANVSSANASSVRPRRAGSTRIV